MKVTVAAVFFLLGTSGCVAHSPQPIESVRPTDSSEAVPPPAPILPNLTIEPVEPSLPELVGCRTLTGILSASAADVDALLPDGYVAAGSGWPVLSTVTLQLESCESIILDNETVIRDASLFFVKATVGVNESLAEGAEIQHYALEAFASHEAVVERWRREGIAAALAEISFLAGDMTTASVRVDGHAWYDVEGGPMVPEDGPELSRVVRHHQATDEGGSRWFDHHRTATQSIEPMSVLVHVDAGVLREITPGSTGHLVVDALTGLSRGTIHFGGIE